MIHGVAKFAIRPKHEQNIGRCGRAATDPNSLPTYQTMSAETAEVRDDEWATVAQLRRLELSLDSATYHTGQGVAEMVRSTSPLEELDEQQAGAPIDTLPITAWGTDHRLIRGDCRRKG